MFFLLFANENIIKKQFFRESIHVSKYIKHNIILTGRWTSMVKVACFLITMNFSRSISILIRITVNCLFRLIALFRHESVEI